MFFFQLHVHNKLYPEEVNPYLAHIHKARHRLIDSQTLSLLSACHVSDKK